MLACKVGRWSSCLGPVNTQPEAEAVCRHRNVNMEIFCTLKEKGTVGAVLSDIGYWRMGFIPPAHLRSNWSELGALLRNIGLRLDKQ